MWWDLHLKYRKRLVMFEKFPEDEEDYQDVLDEIKEDDERRKEIREERTLREKQSRDYIDEQRRFKAELKEKNKDVIRERRVAMGLPADETEEEFKQQEIDKAKQQKAMDELISK